MAPTRLTAAAIAQVLLCSISGDIFPSSKAERHQAGATGLKIDHLKQMLGILGVWIGDPQASVHQAAASDEAPLLDACRYDKFDIVLADLPNNV